MLKQDFRKPVIAISLLLFFLQAIRVAFSTLFGIIYDQIFDGPTTAFWGIAVGALLLVLVMPSFLPREGRRDWMLIAAGITAIARVAFNINEAPVRFWSSLIVLAGGGVYLGVLLSRRREKTLELLLVLP